MPDPEREKDPAGHLDAFGESIEGKPSAGTSVAPLILGGLALVVVVLLLWRFPEFGGDVPGEGSGVSTQPAEESSPAEGVPIPETGQLPQSISDSMLPSSKLSPSWNPWVQDL